MQQQIKPPHGVAFDIQYWRCEFHQREFDDLLQRAHVVQRDFQRVKLQQILLRGVLNLHCFGLHIARELYSDAGRLLEGQFQIGIQLRADEAHRQAGGQVSQVGLQIQLVQMNSGVCLATVFERRGGSLRVKAATVEFERQLRLGFDFAMGIQVAQKRHAQVQRPQLVGFAHGFVIEIEAGAFERHVK